MKNRNYSRKSMTLTIGVAKKSRDSPPPDRARSPSRYRSVPKAKMRKSAPLLWRAFLAIAMLVTLSTSEPTNHCDESKNSRAGCMYGGASFAGIAYDRSTELDPDVCTSTSANHYMEWDLEGTAISTIVLGTVWQNCRGTSLTNTPILRIAFDDRQPSSSEVNFDWSKYTWIKETNSCLSTVFHFDPPEWGKYLIIHYDCRGNSPCYDVRVHEIGCYANIVAQTTDAPAGEPFDFIDGDWSPNCGNVYDWSSLDNPVNYAVSGANYFMENNKCVGASVSQFHTITWDPSWAIAQDNLALVFLPAIDISRQYTTSYIDSITGLTMWYWTTTATSAAGQWPWNSKITFTVTSISNVYTEEIQETDSFDKKDINLRMLPVTTPISQLYFDFDTVNYQAGIMLMKTTAPCTDEDSCNDPKCVQAIWTGSQDTAEDLTLGGTLTRLLQLTFSEECQPFLSLQSTQPPELAPIETFTETETTDTNFTLDLQIADASDASLVVSGLYAYNINIAHTSSTSVVTNVFNYDLDVNYINPCTATNYVDNLGTARTADQVIASITHEVGVYTPLTVNLHDLIQDAASQASGGDGWSLCNTARTYTLSVMPTEAIPVAAPTNEDMFSQFEIDDTTLPGVPVLTTVISNQITASQTLFVELTVKIEIDSGADIITNQMTLRIDYAVVRCETVSIVLETNSAYTKTAYWIHINQVQRIHAAPDVTYSATCTTPNVIGVKFFEQSGTEITDPTQVGCAVDANNQVTVAVSYATARTDPFIIRYQEENWSPQTQANTALKVVVTEEVLVTIVDNCNDPSISSIVTPSVLDMTTSVLRVNSEYATLNVHDTTQEFVDPEPGLYLDSTDPYHWRYSNTFCGDIAMTPTYGGTSADFVEIDFAYRGTALVPRQIRVAPTLNSQKGVYTITLDWSFVKVGYAAVTATQTFTITVLACEIKQKNYAEVVDITITPAFPFYVHVVDVSAAKVPFPNPATDPLDYIIHDPTIYMNLKNYVFEPKCNYIAEFSLDVTYAADGAPITSAGVPFYPRDPNPSQALYLYSTDLLDEGSYKFTSTLTLTDYDSAFGDSEYPTEFFVDIHDPCYSTTLTPTITESVVEIFAWIDAIDGDRYYEYENYEDNVSHRVDPTDQPHTHGLTECTPRIHELREVHIDHATTQYVRNPEPPNYMDVLVSDRNVKINYGTDKSSNRGVKEVQLKVYLENYPLRLDQSVIFKVTFFQQTANLNLPDLEYQLGQGEVDVTIQTLNFNPSLPSEVNPITGENGAQIITIIELKVDDVYVAMPDDFSVFHGDVDPMILRIDTSESIYLGYNKVRITYSGQDYVSGQRYQTEFAVDVKPLPVLDQFQFKTRPQFDLSGLDASLSFDILQGDGWSLDLPPGTHEDDLVVIYNDVELGSSAAFVKYDQERDGLDIEKGATNSLLPQSYTIKMQLIDEVGALSKVLTLTINIIEPATEEDSSGSSSLEIDSSIGNKFANLLEERKKLQEALLSSSIEVKPPSVAISQVDETGLITIDFSNKMAIQGVKADIMSLSSSNPTLRKLQDSENEVIEIFGVDLIGGEYSKKEDLGFKWKVSSFTESQMKVQLTFDKPQYISFNDDKETIEVQFKSEDYFYDSYGQSLSPQTKLVKVIPKQYASAGEKEKLESLESTLATGTQGLFAANFAVNLLLSASIQYLWEMINAQQLVIMLPLLKLGQIPHNAEAIFKVLMTIAAFELIPTDDIYSNAGEQSEAIPLADNFETIGFEHHLLLYNFGTLGFFSLGVYPVIYMVMYCCKPFICCKKRKKKIGRWLYWGALLRIIIESYLIGMVCTFLNVNHLDFRFGQIPSFDFVNHVLTLVVGAILVYFPIRAVHFMNANFSKIKQQGFIQVYGELWEGFDTSTKQFLYYWFYDYLRKVAIAFSVTIMQEQLWLQMSIIYMSSVFMIIATGHLQVRKTSFAKKMDYFNELKIMTIMYHMMLFTDFVPDPEAQYKMGWSCAVCVTVGLAVNMIMMFVMPLRDCKRCCRLRKFKKILKKQRADKSRKPQGKGYVQRQIKSMQEYRQNVGSMLAEYLQVVKQQEFQERHIENRQRRKQRRQNAMMGLEIISERSQEYEQTQNLQGLKNITNSTQQLQQESSPETSNLLALGFSSEEEKQVVQAKRQSMLERRGGRKRPNIMERMLISHQHDADEQELATQMLQEQEKELEQKREADIISQIKNFDLSKGLMDLPPLPNNSLELKKVKIGVVASTGNNQLIMEESKQIPFPQAAASEEEEKKETSFMDRMLQREAKIQQELMQIETGDHKVTNVKSVFGTDDIDILEKQFDQIRTGSIVEDESLSDEDETKAQLPIELLLGSSDGKPKQISWEDLDYFHNVFGIGIKDIEKLPGYTNFEIVDSPQFRHRVESGAIEETATISPITGNSITLDDFPMRDIPAVYNPLKIQQSTSLPSYKRSSTNDDSLGDAQSQALRWKQSNLHIGGASHNTRMGRRKNQVLPRDFVELASQDSFVTSESMADLDFIGARVTDTSAVSNSELINFTNDQEEMMRRQQSMADNRQSKKRKAQTMVYF